MDDMTKRIFLSVGLPGVPLFMLFVLMKYIYSDSMVEFFGSERVFLITILLVLVLFSIFIFSLLSKKKNDGVVKKINSVTYKNNSTHNGDNRF